MRTGESEFVPSPLPTLPLNGGGAPKLFASAHRSCLLQKHIENLRRRRRPDVAARHGLRERVFERADAEGLADDPGVERQRQDAAAVSCRLGTQHLELIAELARIGAL